MDSTHQGLHPGFHTSSLLSQIIWSPGIATSSLKYSYLFEILLPFTSNSLQFVFVSFKDFVQSLFCSRHCLTLTFNLLTHLFVQLSQALLAAYAGSPLHRAGSFIAAHGLSSCGSGAPEGAISVVSAHWFSCPKAHGILILWPGIKFMSPELQVRFLTPGPRGKFPAGIF